MAGYNYNPYTNQNNSGIIIAQSVQSEEDAKSRYVQPGTSALLMDGDHSVFYIKTVDQSGMPSPLRIFDFTERKPENPMVNDLPEYLSEDSLEKKISAIIDKKMSEKKGSKK